MPRDKQKRKATSRAYHQANRDKDNARTRSWRLAHPVQGKAQNRAYSQTLKTEALRLLGNKCACPGCEVSEPAFLTIDHITGKPRGTRLNPIFDARRSNWDKTRFQILCWNCNMTKRDRGFCPVHQIAPGQTNGHSPGANAQQTLWTL